MYNVRQVMKQKMPSRPILIGEYSVSLDEHTISYTLKQSFRAKLIWLDIKRKTGLTVTVPSSYDIKYLHEYLKSNSRWILRNLEKYCDKIPTLPQFNSHTASTISYLGKNITVLQKRNNSRGQIAVKLEQNNLVVSLDSSRKKLSADELEQWYRSQASKLINEKVRKYSQQMGLVYNRVVIRDQKSRWGSCSYRKNLNFNWRLIMAPEPVLEYVVIHELCHLKEMSHSKIFWNLVARYCPRWHELRDWLDNHCFELNASLQI